MEDDTKSEIKIAETIEKPQKTDHRSKKLLLLACLPLGAICLILLLLLVIRPEIQVAWLTPGQYEISEDPINSLSGYPIYKFPTRAKLSTATTTQLVEGEFKTQAGDFKEGENEITAVAYQDMILFRFISIEKVTKKVQVDRIAPELKLESALPQFSLLAPVDIKLKSEAGAKLTIDEKEADTFEISELTAKLSPKTGSHKYKLFATDMAGNPSETLEVALNAFNEPGFVQKSCDKLVFPLDNDKFVVGSSKLFGKDCGKNPGTDYLLTSIQPKNAVFPCTGGCDANPSYISIRIYTKSLDAALKDLIFAGSKIESRTKITTKSGIAAELFHIKHNSEVFYTEFKMMVFERGGKTYAVIADLGSNLSIGGKAISKTLLEENWKDIYDNLIVKDSV